MVEGHGPPLVYGARWPQRSRFDSGKGKPSIILWSNDVVRLRPCSLNLHRQKMRVDHEKFIVRK